MNKKHIVSLVLAAVLVFASAIPAFAYSGTVTGEQFTLTKYLLMDKDAQAVPDVNFTFTVSPGEAVPAEGILAGVGKITVPQVSFSSSDSAVGNEDPEASKVPGMSAEKKFVKKTVSIDFTSAGFTNPGIYRYLISETASDKGYITSDSAQQKKLDVYVVNGDTDDSLKIGGYVLHTAGTETKANGFTNTYDTYDLTLENKVEGNQASHTQYFKFTVKLTNSVDGTYNVTLTNADQDAISSSDDYSGQTNDKTVTISSGTGTATFYLKNGQSIVIPGLAKGTNYEITETDADGYTVSDTGKQGALDADKTVTFTNTKGGVIPTGVMLVVAPFAALMVVGGVGAFAIAKKKRNEEA